jgi:UDP-glucose 4-epimerase
MMPSKTLVTGAAGFIGSHVVDACMALGMEVVAADDLSGGFAHNVPAGCPFIKGDLRSPEFCAELWKYGPYRYVYHFAAYAAEGLSHFIRRFNYQSNLIASVNLINEAIKAGSVECFLYASSIAVYGSKQVPMKEDLVPEPEDPYGISKYAVELDLRAAQRLFGLNFIIVRPHNVYGERQNIADPYRNVVGIFMNQALSGQPMTIFGDGSQTRAFSYIGDVAPLIARCPLQPAAINQVFNIGADTPCTVLELAHTIAKVLKSEPNIRHLPARRSRSRLRGSFQNPKAFSCVHACWSRNWTGPHGRVVESARPGRPGAFCKHRSDAQSPAQLAVKFSP